MKKSGCKKRSLEEKRPKCDRSHYYDRKREKGIYKKENVWPKPDYDKMLQEGVSKRVIWFQKRIRDSTPAKPRFNPLKNPAVSQEEYITFMSKLSIMCET